MIIILIVIIITQINNNNNNKISKIYFKVRKQLIIIKILNLKKAIEFVLNRNAEI